MHGQKKNDGNEERDRCLIGRTLNCIRLLRRQVFHFYHVPAMVLGSLVPCSSNSLGITCFRSSVLKQELPL